METETSHRALCAAMSAATRAKDARVDLLAYDPAFSSATRAELLAAVVAAVIDEASAWARALAAEARESGEAREAASRIA